MSELAGKSALEMAGSGPGRRGRGWPVSLRVAGRELRGGLRGFRIFIACLALGVAAIASVGSISSALLRGLAEEGQTILGGDVAFSLVHRQVNARERAWLDQVTARGGAVSQTASMRSMLKVAPARPAGDGGPDRPAAETAVGRARPDRTVIELKAVDQAYPLYGEVILSGGGRLADALAPDAEGVFGAVAEPLLLSRLGLSPGDRVQIGKLELELRDTIAREPDRVGDGFAFAPRVMISDAALAQTGLVTLGSLVNYQYRVRLPEGARDNAAVAAFTAATRAALPDAGWRIRDRSNSAPGLRRTVGQVALFLTLVGLTALVVGGVGVGNAIKSYMDGKREVIATLKCLGAPGGLIFRIYFAQVMAIAAVGILAGMAIGAAVPGLAQALLADLLPVPARFALYPGALALAGIYGMVTATAFALWPLARARDIPAAGLFRDIVAPVRRFPRPAYLLMMAAALLALAGMAVYLTDPSQRSFAAWFVLGVALSFAALLAAARAVTWLARAAGRPRLPGLRMALANLYRPGAPTASVVLSLGLGLTLLVAVSLIDGNITRQVTSRLPARAPSFFFLDLQKHQLDAFNAILADTPGVIAVNRVPMIRGPITAVNGVPAGEVEATPETQWALRGDRGLTYSARLPEGSELVAGSWWPEDYAGPPLISFSRELAEGWGIGIGDTLSVNVLGREITGTIASLRDINWQTGGINFILVFSPGVLEGAPQTILSTVTMEAAGEEELQRRVTDAFPNVTAIRMKEAIGAVSGLLEDLVVAVRATSALAIIAGILVLAGAMAAGHRHRVYDSVLLKVLGATRARILGIYALEYGLLGLATALVAAAAGTTAAWLVITQVMQADWIFLPGTLAATIGGAALVTTALGLAGTWSALSGKAAPVLRAP